MYVKKFNELNEKLYDIPYYMSKFREIHGDKYDYPEIEKFLKNSHSKINIYCKKCGTLFNQTVSHHIWSKSGCRVCYGNSPNTVDKILKKSKDVHGDGRYLYPNINDEKISAFSKITILCNNCDNVFKQTVASHLNKKNGCNRCSKSKTETLIENYLISNKIEFIPQYKFDKCIYKKKLPFDFFLPKYNLCIEYDGEQHFNSRRDDKMVKI
jgi:formylmethanofuran dehydrogenase subunit E